MPAAALLLAAALLPGLADAIEPTALAVAKEPALTQVSGNRKKCPFLTRWSPQWRKCVWIIQT
jgi:hypothetical protein